MEITIEDCIFALGAKVAFGTVRGRDRIGRLNGDVGIGFRKGDFVLYEPYETGEKCTIARPYKSHQLGLPRLGSLTDVSPIVGVPIGLVDPVDARRELRELREAQGKSSASA